jgi:hypothetical protein
MLPEFSDRLQAQLREFVPAEASVRNPIDLIGTTDLVQFGRSLEILQSCCEIDSIIVIYIPRLANTTPAIAAVVETAAARGGGKPVLAVLMEAEQDGTPIPAVADESEGLHLPVLGHRFRVTDFEEAARLYVGQQYAEGGLGQRCTNRNCR